ncbi:MAG TPA: hypothetical protein PKV73_07805 [Agriterribacter sp.]|nr:hypothetical protein [Chitinophagaceae bacterium]HRP31779.1 hypothetical protein [Agriterribacter sp.]
MSKFIRNFLGKAGLQIRKSVIINLRDQNVHPIDFVYLNDKRERASAILLNIPIATCRTQIWNTLEQEKNPFVKTLGEYANNKALSYHNSVMNVYYQKYTPKNAAQVVRLPGNEILKTIPAMGYILPWENSTVEEILKIRERDALKENTQAGQKFPLSYGYTDFGPVKDEKGIIEFNRLVTIYNNIKQLGFMEKPYLSDGGIKGYFLVNTDNDWCFIIKSGKHRAYALSALGYQHIPVIVDNYCGIIQRESDCHFWPQVKSGIFSEHEARFFANNILNIGNQTSSVCY